MEVGEAVLAVGGVFKRSLPLGRGARMGRVDGVMRFDEIIWRGVG